MMAHDGSRSNPQGHLARWTLGVSRSALPLLALILLAWALRVHALDFQPLWFDEGKSVFFANQPASDTALLTAADIHPPLYYYLLHAWALLAEWSPLALRFLSATCSLLAVPLAYQLGRLLSGRRAVGLLAALFLTLSPMHVYYAQEARMYALLATLGLASTVLMLRALTLTPGPSPVGRGEYRRWLAYLALTIAALYTHYYAVFIPLFQTIWVLVWAWRDAAQRRHVWPWLGRLALVGLAYAPWIMLSYQVLTSYVVTKVAHEAYAPLSPAAYLTDHLLAFGGSPQAAWVFAALAGGGVLAAWRMKRWAAIGLLLYLFIPLAAGFVINLYFPFHPPYYERQFLYAAPAWYLLAAFGLTGLADLLKKAAPGRWPRLLAPGVALAALFVLIALHAPPLDAFYTTPRHTADDYRPLMAQVRAQAQSGDVVACIYPWQAGYFQSYLAPQSRPMLYYVPYTSWDEPAGMAAGLDALLAGYPRLWFPSYQTAGRVLETRVETYLAQQAYVIEQEWYENNKLSFYAAPRPLPAPLPGARFGEAITLVEYQMTAGETPSAWGVVAVLLTWRVQQAIDQRYLVTLRLADAAGRTWALSDSEPQAGLWPFALWPLDEPGLDRRGLIVPAGTPPGAYKLYLSLNRPAGNQPLSVTGFDGAARGAELFLGQVNVVAPRDPPPLAALPIQYPRRARFGDVQLLGYSLGAGPLLAGQPASITLFWQAVTAPAGDYVLAVELRDAAGHNLAQSAPRPLGDFYPTGRWRAGELVTDPYQITPAASISQAQELRLQVAVYDAASQPVGEPAALQWVLVIGRQPNYDVPPIAHPVDARLGAGVRLLGYQIAPANRPLQPGQTLDLTLYWQCLAPLDTSYKVFTHLIDPHRPADIWAQDDAVPGQGAAPTTSWVPGEVLTDTYRLTIQPDTPRGAYQLGVGMYDPVSNARLPVTDAAGAPAGDHLLLQAVSVEVAYP